MRCGDGSTLDPGACPELSGQGAGSASQGSPVPALVAGRREPPTGSRRNCFLVGSWARGCALDSAFPEVLGPCPRLGAVPYRIQKVVEGVSVGSGESPGMGIRTWNPRLPLQLIHWVK